MRVTRSKLGERDLDWGRTGRIVFSGNSFDIYTIKANGKGLRVLTAHK